MMKMDWDESVKRVTEVLAIVALLAIIAFCMVGVSYVVDLMNAAPGANEINIGSQAVTRFSELAVSGTIQAEQVTSTDDMTVADALSAASVTVSGDVAVGDDISIASFVQLTAQTAITVTDGGVLTPTGTLQLIQAGEEVTPTIASGSAGDLLVVVNSSTNTVNIADTGATKLSAAAALGQYDNLTLWSDGTNWIELSRTDN